MKRNLFSRIRGGVEDKCYMLMLELEDEIYSHIEESLDPNDSFRDSLDELDAFIFHTGLERVRDDS